MRAAVLDKDLAAVEKLLNRLTKSKDVSETDPYAAIVGLLIESGDVLVMNDIADLLERMMYARSGTESGGTFITDTFERASAISHCCRRFRTHGAAFDPYEVAAVAFCGRRGWQFSIGDGEGG